MLSSTLTGERFMSDPNDIATPDPNNIPQQVTQLKEVLETDDSKKSKEDKNIEIADTQFDKEYEMAKESSNGSGFQSSDPNPVNREPAEAGMGEDQLEEIYGDEPGDPSNYLEMAKDLTPEPLKE
jgi:hypothetical protein